LTWINAANLVTPALLGGLISQGVMIMDMLLIQPIQREPIDCIAEGLRKFACGDSGKDAWEALSEDEKAWWRGFASEAAARFATEIASERY
jgi:hypothetical protein